MEMTSCSGPFGRVPNGSLLTCPVSLGSGLCRILADAGEASVTATAKPSAQTLPVKARRRRRKASRLYSVRNVSPGQRNPRFELQILLKTGARHHHAAPGDI